MTSDVQKWVQIFANHFIEEVHGDICPPLFTEMLLAARELFLHDSELPKEPHNPSLIEAGRYRDECEVIARRFQPRDSLLYFNQQLEKIFQLLPLPPPARLNTEEVPRFAVPLIDLLPRMNEAIFKISDVLTNHEAQRRGFFSRTRKMLDINWKQHGDPFKFKGTNHELIRAYFGGTAFASLFQVNIPFSIPLQRFQAHGIIIAPPEHGKTQLLQTLIHGFLKEEKPPGLVVLDPHGDLFNTLKTRVDPKRLVLLDPDTDPPALNFLDFGTSTDAETLQTFSYLMSSLSGGLSDKQGAIVPYLLKLLRRIPEASLETLRQIVDEKVKRLDQSAFYPAIQTLDPVDQGFFHNQFYSQPMQVTKDAIGWKLYSALASDAFRQMFSAKENSFNASEAMAEGKVVLVRGSENSLGEHGMPVFLQFIVAQYFMGALKRARIPPNERHLCLIVADEASHVFNHQTTRILTECRKWGLGFLGASQLWHQVPEEVKSAILGATAIKMVGAIQHNDASVLSREMYTDIESIRSCKTVDRSHAEWMFYATRMGLNKAIKLTVPYGTLEKEPQYPTHKPPGRAASDATSGVGRPVSDAPLNIPPATIRPKKEEVNKAEPQVTKPKKAEQPQAKAGLDTDY